MKETQLEREFRNEVSTWLAAEMKKFKSSLEADSLDLNSPYARKAWEDIVCAGGWSGLCWPKEYGGKDLALEYYIIYLEEYARLDCPAPLNTLGPGILGPLLLKYGSQEQKQRFIPPLIRNEEVWCQGYSEPQAGSDLAGIATSAKRQEDCYLVNGHKIWTSLAQYADFCFLLVRTQEGSVRHQGISFLLVDLKSPGITIDPIRQISGDQDFCEVRYENVKVPLENCVGEENGGWRMAMAAANFERATYMVPRQILLAREVTDLWRLAQHVLDDKHLQRNQLWQERLVQLSVSVNSLRLIAEKTLTSNAPGAESSYSKLLYSQALQAVYDYAMELMGERACLGPNGDWGIEDRQWRRGYLKSRGLTIAGGTSEIHKNIIAEKLLGLPK